MTLIYQMKGNSTKSALLIAPETLLLPLGGLVPVAADLALVCSTPSALSLPILLVLAMSESVGLCT